MIGTARDTDDHQAQSEVADAADFETAIHLTGNGRFHFVVLIAGSMCMLAAGFENALNAYILPSVHCDLQMTTEAMGLVNVLFFAGGIMSIYLCGLLADLYGRKLVLVVAMVMDSIILIFSSFSQHLIILLVFRFLSGFVIGVPSSLIFPYVGEFHAGPRQTTCVCYVGFFWALSWMLTPGIAWLIIPITWSIRVPHFTYNSWRMFVAFFAIPSTIGATMLTILPESPRYLLAQGRTEEAHKVLTKMYAMNTGNPPEQYPMTLSSLQFSSRHLKTDSDNNSHKEDKCKTFCSMLIAMWKQTKELARPPILVYSLILSCLVSAMMVGGYGFGLWFPELIQRFVQHQALFPNQTATMCEHAAKKPFSFMAGRTASFQERTKLAHKRCDGGDVVDHQVFPSTLIIGTSCLAADFLYLLLANRVSHSIILAVSLNLAGLCSIALYYVRTSTQIIIISCLFESGIEIAYFGVFSVAMHCFPTKIRAVAMCTCILVGRIGAILINLVFGELFDSMCEVPTFLTAGVLFAGGLLSRWVPSRVAEKQRTTATAIETGVCEEETSDTKL